MSTKVSSQPFAEPVKVYQPCRGCTGKFVDCLKHTEESPEKSQQEYLKDKIALYVHPEKEKLEKQAKEKGHEIVYHGTSDPHMLGYAKEHGGKIEDLGKDFYVGGFEEASKYAHTHLLLVTSPEKPLINNYGCWFFPGKEALPPKHFGEKLALGLESQYENALFLKVLGIEPRKRHGKVIPQNLMVLQAWGHSSSAHSTVRVITNCTKANVSAKVTGTLLSAFLALNAAMWFSNSRNNSGGTSAPGQLADEAEPTLPPPPRRLFGRAHEYIDGNQTGKIEELPEPKPAVASTPQATPSVAREGWDPLVHLDN